MPSNKARKAAKAATVAQPEVPTDLTIDDFSLVTTKGHGLLYESRTDANVDRIQVPRIRIRAETFPAEILAAIYLSIEPYEELHSLTVTHGRPRVELHRPKTNQTSRYRPRSRARWIFLLLSSDQRLLYRGTTVNFLLTARAAGAEMKEQIPGLAIRVLEIIDSASRQVLRTMTSDAADAILPLQKYVLKVDRSRSGSPASSQSSSSSQKSNKRRKALVAAAVAAAAAADTAAAAAMTPTAAAGAVAVAAAAAAAEGHSKKQSAPQSSPSTLAKKRSLTTVQGRVNRPGPAAKASRKASSPRKTDVPSVQLQAAQQVADQLYATTQVIMLPSAQPAALLQGAAAQQPSFTLPTLVPSPMPLLAAAQPPLLATAAMQQQHHQQQVFSAAAGMQQQPLAADFSAAASLLADYPTFAQDMPATLLPAGAPTLPGVSHASFPVSAAAPLLSLEQCMSIGPAGPLLYGPFGDSASTGEWPASITSLIATTDNSDLLLGLYGGEMQLANAGLAYHGEVPPVQSPYALTDLEGKLPTVDTDLFAGVSSEGF